MGCIYGLFDPRSGKVRYIGLTRRRPDVRLKGHISASKTGNIPSKRWIRGLLADGVEPQIRILEECDGDLEGLEVDWISLMRDVYDDLLNVTVGGDGGGVPVGFRFSAESSRRKSESHLKRFADDPTLREEMGRRSTMKSPGWKERARTTSIEGRFWERQQPPRGESNGVAKLTEADVLEIRRLWTTGQYTQGQLGSLFGVGRGNISHVVTRRSWSHI